MIPKCDGCKYEWEEACLRVGINELHLATTPDSESSYPFGRHHFGFILVNDKGEKVMW